MGVALVSAFLADAADDAFDLLRGNLQPGQVIQTGASLTEGSARHDPGIGDLLQDRATGIAAIKAEALGLREKKPSDSSDSKGEVRAIGLLRPK